MRRQEVQLPSSYPKAKTLCQPLIAANSLELGTDRQSLNFLGSWGPTPTIQYQRYCGTVSLTLASPTQLMLTPWSWGITNFQCQGQFLSQSYHAMISWRVQSASVTSLNRLLQFYKWTIARCNTQWSLLITLYCILLRFCEFSFINYIIIIVFDYNINNLYNLEGYWFEKIIRIEVAMLFVQPA